MHQLLHDKLFAIQPEALVSLLAAARLDLSSMAPPRRASLTREGKAAVIAVHGPLFAYETLFTQVFNASSYEGIAAQLDEALASPATEIILHIDSPGGEVNGCSELAAKIRAASSVKPVTAFISGQGCSAAYWLASAAMQVVAADTAQVGSLGVIALVGGREAGEELKIISRQTPFKAAEAHSDEGRAQVQAKVDDLCAVFLGAVATHRGTTLTEVDEKFGQGKVFVGAHAEAAGLVDKVGTFADIKGAAMQEEVVIDKIKLHAQAEERTRITGILSLRGDAAITEELIASGVSVGGAAISLRHHELKATAARGDYLGVLAQGEKELRALTPARSEVEESADDIINFARKYGV